MNFGALDKLFVKIQSSNCCRLLNQHHIDEPPGQKNEGVKGLTLEGKNC
jgi:hypothetical protein